MPEIFNWQLISNPANWLIVFLMVAIPMVALTVVKHSIAPSN